MPNTKYFFLGSNTFNGFYSYFNEIKKEPDLKTLYLLKGTAGSGKSSLMKKVLQKSEKKGNDTEAFYCSSDFLSLDGILDKTEGFAILDATAPHIVNPDYPGVFEKIINLEDFLNREKLKKNKSKIINLQSQISEYHKKATDYIKAANDTEKIICKKAKEHISEQKLKKVQKQIEESLKLYAEKGKKRKTENSKKDFKRIRLLSAVSVGKNICLNKTLEKYKTQIFLNDGYFAAQQIIINNIKDKFKNGLEYICPSGICPNITEHLLYKDIALISVNGHFETEKEKQKNKKQNFEYALTDFYKATVKTEKEELNGLINISQTFLNGACAEVKKAKALHDILESYFISVMNFEEFNCIINGIK